jgi:hypothetical protein
LSAVLSAWNWIIDELVVVVEEEGGINKAGPGVI